MKGHRSSLGVPWWADTSQVVRLLLTLALLNLPFWLLSSHVFLRRGLFSLDAVLVLLLLALSPVWGAAAIIVSWACDIALTAALTYHFTSPLEFIQSITFAGNLDWTEMVGLREVLLASPFALAGVGLMLVKPQRLNWQPVVCALLLLLTIDALNGSSLLSKRDVRLIGSNVASSSMLTILQEGYAKSQSQEALKKSGDSDGTAEFERLLPGVMTGPEGVLYVMVESFGVHRDASIREWLSDQLYPTAIRSGYELVAGQLSSNGGTTAAELKRLCGLQGSYRNLNTVPETPCLPHRMASAGRRTLGLHGFSDSMFDRRRWWPLLGLQHVEFAEQLGPRIGRLCGGAFQGICDEDLISIAVAAIARERSFVYVLTLNTHLPVAPIELPGELAAICKAANTGDEVCMMQAQLGVVLRSIPWELSRQDVRPYVVVVGDHPPPFSELQSRNQFSAGQVPVLVLKPKRQTEQ